MHILHRLTPATPIPATAHHYRPEIDGLRAIAVALVLVFHAFPESLPRGFVGVDVFFVISGYLISGLIFADLQQGRFSFADFYAWRIRRIFPALISWSWLLPLCWDGSCCCQTSLRSWAGMWPATPVSSLT